MTKMGKNRDREILESGVVSKVHRPIVSQRKLPIVIHFFIPVDDKRIVDPSRLSVDVNLCVTIAGNPHCLVYMFYPITHLDHHRLTFNGVYTSVKQNLSPFQEKEVSLINFGMKGPHNQFSPLRINGKTNDILIINSAYL